MASSSNFLYREPISILTLLQLPLILLATVPVALYRASLELQVSCYNSIRPKDLSLSWGFYLNLFDLREVSYVMDPCGAGGNNTTTLVDVDLRSETVLFVGVLWGSLVYVLLGLVVYRCCWLSYNRRQAPLNLASLDLLLKCGLGIATLVASAIWLAATIRLHSATSESALEEALAALIPCQNKSGVFDAGKCPISYDGWFGLLYATSAVGFLSGLFHLFLLWPVFKRTPCAPTQSKVAARNNHVVYAKPPPIQPILAEKEPVVVMEPFYEEPIKKPRRSRTSEGSSIPDKNSYYTFESGTNASSVEGKKRKRRRRRHPSAPKVELYVSARPPSAHSHSGQSRDYHSASSNAHPLAISADYE